MHTRFFIIHIYKSVCIHGTAQSLPLPSLKNCINKTADCGLYIARSAFVLVSTVIFFLGVALFFFSDFIRRDQKRSFQTVFGMFLLMVLSHLSSLLSVSGISPDMISQDALGGNAKAIMVRAPEK